MFVNEIIKKSIKEKLLSDLTDQEFDDIIPIIGKQTFLYPAEEVLIRENDINSKHIFVMLSGEARIVKTGENGSEKIIANIYRGDFAGEMGLIGKEPPCATVKTTKESMVLKISIDKLQKNTEYQPLYRSLMASVAKTLVNRPQNTNETLSSRLGQTFSMNDLKTKSFIILALTLFAFSVFMFSAEFICKEKILLANLIGLAPIYHILAVVFVIFMIFIVNKIDLPVSYIGLNANNIKQQIIEALLVSITGIIFLMGYKDLISPVTSSSISVPFICSSAGGKGCPFANVSSSYIFASIFFYSVFCFIQEFFARGCLQSAIRGIFLGPDYIKPYIVVLSSSVIYAMLYSHLFRFNSIYIVIPGIIFGYLFERHKSLVGVTLAHIILGTFAVYAIGIQGLIG